MIKKVALAFVLIGALAAGVYLVYFHKPPAKDILAANRKLHTTRELHDVKGHKRSKLQKFKDAEYDEEFYEDGENADYNEEDGDSSDDTTPKGSILKWERWVEKNEYVAIGRIFNKCEGDDRIMVGRGIMLEDGNGGLKTRTYINITWEEEITDGQFYLVSKYNGKELYSNHWDLCTIDEEKTDRVVFCPVSGKKNYVKDMKIPSYLPKGHFENKVWVTDQNDKEIICSYSEFDL